MNNVFSSLEIDVPWIGLPNGERNAGLAAVAKKEINWRHILFRKTLIPIARRCDNDDVLFYLPDTKEYAIVHLIWQRVSLFDEGPFTEIYHDINSLKQRITSDCEYYRNY